MISVMSSIRVKQSVTLDTVARTPAVARARVDGIVDWGLFVVEHDMHSQWLRSKACATCLQTRDSAEARQ